jgi:hypothetical protein
MKSLKEVTGQIVSVHYPELRSYFTLKPLLHSELKQVMSLFTLKSARAVLVVALVYSFPDVFNVIMALISPMKPEFTCYNLFDNLDAIG